MYNFQTPVFYTITHCLKKCSHSSSQEYDFTILNAYIHLWTKKNGSYGKESNEFHLNKWLQG